MKVKWIVMLLLFLISTLTSLCIIRINVLKFYILMQKELLIDRHPSHQSPNFLHQRTLLTLFSQPHPQTLHTNPLINLPFSTNILITQSIPPYPPQKVISKQWIQTTKATQQRSRPPFPTHIPNYRPNQGAKIEQKRGCSGESSIYISQSRMIQTQLSCQILVWMAISWPALPKEKDGMCPVICWHSAMLSQQLILAMNRRPLPRKYRNTHRDLSPLKITHHPQSCESLPPIKISQLLHSKGQTMAASATEQKQEYYHQVIRDAPQEIDSICSSLTSLETEWEQVEWLKQPDCETQPLMEKWVSQEGTIL